MAENPSKFKASMQEAISAPEEAKKEVPQAAPAEEGDAASQQSAAKSEAPK